MRHVNEIIASCNAKYPRIAFGKILLLPDIEVRALLQAFRTRPDDRFGDNLLDACRRYIKIRDKWPNMIYALAVDPRRRIEVASVLTMDLERHEYVGHVRDLRNKTAELNLDWRTYPMAYLFEVMCQHEDINEIMYA